MAKPKKRQTIGENPLDAIIPAHKAAKASTRGLAVADNDVSDLAKDKPKKTPKVRATFHIPAELLEEARNAVVTLSGPPARLTLAKVAENALRTELNYLKAKYNKGKDFPQREADLEGGRPVGS